MILPVVGPEGGLVEWAMVELQGRIENLEGTEEELKELGTLSLPSAGTDVVHLTVGYHQLVGKRVALKKPFAIMQQVDVDPGSQREGLTQQYQVMGVIRSKYLFKTRPTALISKPRR